MYLKFDIIVPFPDISLGGIIRNPFLCSDPFSYYINILFFLSYRNHLVITLKESNLRLIVKIGSKIIIFYHKNVTLSTFPTRLTIRRWVVSNSWVPACYGLSPGVNKI